MCCFLYNRSEVPNWGIVMPQSGKFWPCSLKAWGAFDSRAGVPAVALALGKKQGDFHTYQGSPIHLRIDEKCDLDSLPVFIIKPEIGCNHISPPTLESHGNPPKIWKLPCFFTRQNNCRSTDITLYPLLQQLTADQTLSESFWTTAIDPIGRASCVVVLSVRSN